MARILLTYGLLLIWALPSGAQLVVSNPEHDFGVLRRADPSWADFVVWNRGERPEVLFRVDATDRTEVLFSQKTIAPGDSALVRVHYSPEEPGEFRLRMPLHASAWTEPQILEISGESTYAAPAGIPCPDFSQEPARRIRPLIVSVRNGWNDEPVDHAKIRVYRDGTEVGRLTTNAYGEVDVEMPRGRYFFVVKHEGRSVDTALFVGAVHDHLLVHLPGLPADESEEPPAVATRTSEPETETEAVVAAEVDPVVEEEEDLPVEDAGLLSTREFKPSNLVFLVDVSSSMKANGKLDLLKIAMTDLVEVLRPTDRFALIEYASNTQTIVATHGGLDKDQCREAIAALEAGGSTAGAKAIDKAGRTAMKQFIEQGNNQIILATDGSFNEGAAKAVKLSKKYREKQVLLSVLGIRCSAFGEKEMRELAEAGGGRFVPIEGSDDAGTRLIEEIKTGARRE